MILPNETKKAKTWMNDKIREKNVKKLYALKNEMIQYWYKWTTIYKVYFMTATLR